MTLIWIQFLRIVHIFAGTLWIGAAVAYMFFFGPSIREAMPGGQKVMQNLISRHRYPIFMSVVSTLTILAGALLYWQDSSGNLAAFASSGPGLGYTIGALASIAVYIVGMVMIRPRAERLGAIGTQVAASGAPPTPEQAAELQTLGQQMHTLEWVDFVLLAIALLTMATARYWLF